MQPLGFCCSEADEDEPRSDAPVRVIGDDDAAASAIELAEGSAEADVLAPTEAGDKPDPGDGGDADDERFLPAVLALVLAALIITPLTLLIIAVVFGVIIALCEGWTLLVGFMYFAGNMTGLGNPLTNSSPQTPMGSVVDIVVSTWVIIICGAFLGVICNLRLVGKLADILPLEGVKGVACLLGLIPALIMLTATLIGAVIAGCEGWTVTIGYRYMISAMCGLGNPLTGRTPLSFHSKIIAIVAASWQLAIGGTIVGLSGAIPILDRALTALDSFCSRLAMRAGCVKTAPNGRASFSVEDSVLPSVLALVIASVVIIPVIMLLIALVFGTIIALCEGWTLTVGFMYFAGNMTGLGNPLTNSSPETPMGSLIDVIVSCWVIILSGAFLGVICNMKLVTKLSEVLPLEGAKGAFCLFVVIPALVMLTAALIGCILAVSEGWTVAIGFRYMISAMCGLGNPLTGRTPVSFHGKIIVIIGASWQLAIGGTIIGLSGAIPLLGQSLTALEQFCLRCLPRRK